MKNHSHLAVLLTLGMTALVGEVALNCAFMTMSVKTAEPAHGGIDWKALARKKERLQHFNLCMIHPKTETYTLPQKAHCSAIAVLDD